MLHYNADIERMSWSLYEVKTDPREQIDLSKTLGLEATQRDLFQTMQRELEEAAEMDGANTTKRFGYIILPHLSRAITIVILIQTIFLLSIFAEIFVTTAGAFGTKTLTYLIFQRVLESQNIGLGSAGGVYAIILANIVAIFLMRIVGKSLDAKES